MPLNIRILIILYVVVGLLMAAYAANASSPPVTDTHFMVAPGYLSKKELPASLDLLGPPPAANSAAFARDEAARTAVLSLRGGKRWEQAAKDADLTFPAPAKNFSCAMGMDITEKATPYTYKIMQRVLTDAGLSTYPTKNKYFRTRPFVAHKEGTCLSDQEALLRNDGSYPSGHTAAGSAWALVLAELNPERQNIILRRGIDFGLSRIICDAHWQSDVDAGRIMGAAVMPALHNNPEFMADMAKAKLEVKSMRSNENSPACKAEAAALMLAQ